VVSGKDVSRRHAEIVHTPKGYLVVDSSTNGTFVNDQQVQGQRILARADVIRIGEEQFRFYADVAPATAEPPPPPGPAASPQQAAPPSPPAPRAAGVPSPDRLKHTVHGMEAVVPPKGSGGGPFASFLVRTGGLIGQRLVVRTPVVNIGRADYNDLVLPDPSVSTSHAKLQRREGVWVLVDLESTNGTFVDGEQVKGDAPLAPGALVRFGDVQLVFEPTDDALGVAKGGGTQVLKTPHSVAPGTSGSPAAPAQASGSPVIPAPPPSPPGARPAPAPGSPGGKPAPAAPRPQPPGRPGGKPAPKRPVNQQPPPPKKGKGCGASAAVLLLAVAGLVALLHRLLA
jgi:pSer/pThr/pTyr-binding forkhead associated (FHA) protein